MAENNYGVTAQGFVTKPLSEIINSYNLKFKAAFGETFDTSPESPDGQVIGIFADEVSQLWDLTHAAYNSYRRAGVSGVGLDSLVELHHINRYVNKPTKVTGFLDGDEGTVVPAGSTARTKSGDEFKSDYDTILPGSVSFTCTKSGEIYVGVNTLTQIVSEIDGWNSVTNPAEGNTGIDYESDPQLRARDENSTVSSGGNTVEAIYDALASLDLSYSRVRDNDTNGDIGSQPPNTLYVVVRGGNDFDIAQAIFTKKPPGVPTFGDTSITVYDKKGFPKVINFGRPKDVPVYVSITFKRSSGSSNDAEKSITSAIVNYLSSLPPGNSIRWADLVPPILASTPSIELDTIAIGLSKDSLSMTTVDLDIDQQGVSSAEQITIADITNK
ncbi:baseplate J/gp47 family protein [Enterobacter ludwigii]|uniref:baseplate J/gp47 family protein n=1 Tax=Enterobacter ludwigii TaxID=299767 RepID=UPI003BEF2F5E